MPKTEASGRSPRSAVASAKSGAGPRPVAGAPRKAKVFAFAPEHPGRLSASEHELITAGCELVQGSAGWRTPLGDNEAEVIALGGGADALMGASIRSTPITRAIMQACPELRIVAKYTIGFDDIDLAAATDLGVIVTHSPTEAGHRKD